jgi:hypothetical protein
MKQRTLIAVKGIFGKILHKPASMVTLLRDEEQSQFQTKNGIELLASIQIVRVKTVETLSEF